MSRRKKIVIIVLVLLIAIQFIRPERNSSNGVQQADFIAQFHVPAAVAGVLKTSCYDCHSNNTRYPWYANVQPIGWFLANHVKEGKEELNFNEFANYSSRRQLSKLKAIGNSVKDGSMPIWSYTLMHTDAKLSNENIALLKDWTDKTIDSISKQ